MRELTPEVKQKIQELADEKLIGANDLLKKAWIKQVEEDYKNEVVEIE